MIHCIYNLRLVLANVRLFPNDTTLRRLNLRVHN